MPDDKELLEDAANCFTYHPWKEDQINKGEAVRLALQRAYEVVISNCPASPDRSTALRKIREARMDANSAITHGGKY
jgi:hypothetical protein